MQILHEPRPSGNADRSRGGFLPAGMRRNRPIEKPLFDAGMTFAADWIAVADQLIGSGFCDPQSFDGLDIRHDDLPTGLHRRLLTVVRAAATVGIEDLQIRIDEVEAMFEPSVRPEVRVAALADGSGVNAALFAEWCREHRRRAEFFHGAQRVLTDSMPIGDLARELLDKVIE